MFQTSFKIENAYTNEQLMREFKCSNSGGMRFSKTINVLVLITYHGKLYKDRWKGDVLYYTGMGLRGDQSLDIYENKRLLNHKSLGIHVHLFEVFNRNQYVYLGEVELIDFPFEEEQLDENGIKRKVYIFPLKLVSEESKRIEIKEKLKEVEAKEERKAKKLTNKQLEDAVSTIPKEPSYRQGVEKIFHRNPIIKIYAKRRANGYCDLCEKPAPFADENGEPYLEVHHIIPLSKGGYDTIDNVVALCPNCHRKVHVLKSERDIAKLVQKAKIRLMEDD